MERLCRTRQALMRTGTEGSSSTGSPPHPSPRPPLSQPHTPSQVLHAHQLAETSVDRFNLSNSAMFVWRICFCYFFMSIHVNLWTSQICATWINQKKQFFFERENVSWHTLVCSNRLDPFVVGSNFIHQPYTFNIPQTQNTNTQIIWFGQVQE